MYIVLTPIENKKLRKTPSDDMTLISNIRSEHSD